jgi:lipoprotein signal peptidase
MSVAELDQLEAGRRDALAARSRAAGAAPAEAAGSPLRRLGLVWVTLAVVTVDWSSKAAAWRLLPGVAIINADTSGAIPVLPGLVSQPAPGALVDGAALVLLAVAAVWLIRTSALGAVGWVGCALVWAGIASNAADRWFGHLWLAPGSKRGVVDWIAVNGGGSINLADIVIGVGLLIAIAALALTRLSRRALAVVAAGVLVLVPVSMGTVEGTKSNAVPVRTGPTYAQRVHAMLWVGSENKGHRMLRRDPRGVAGWNLTVEALDDRGLVLAQWRLPWESTVAAIPLPPKTDTIYVTVDDTGWTMTLANNLQQA